MTHHPLRALFVEQLRDLYDAEQQILTALPPMIDAASHEELRTAFREHFQQTQNQVIRLQRVFEGLGERVGGQPCEGMRGIIAEGQRMIQRHLGSEIGDAALIAAAQRVEHYEIAGYGCVQTYADLLGYSDQASLLQQTLDEEKDTDHRLTKIAERVANVEAIRA